MNNYDDQQTLKHQLVLLTDAYVKLSENPVWAEFTEKHPDLEELRQAAVEAADLLWWRFRTRCSQNL